MLCKKLKLYVQIFITFLKISTFTIGGGFAAIPLLQSELIDKRKWINEEELTDIIAVSQIVPGLLYVTVSSFIGYRIAGIIGAVIATVAVIIPSVIAVLTLAFLLADYFNVEFIQKIFRGIIAGVTGMIISVAVNLFKKSINDFITLFVFIFSLILLEFYNVETYILILLGIIVGFLYYMIYRRREDKC